MAIRQRMDQRQVQKLILAPSLQQAIKLLSLTNLELIEVIDEEISQNPMLELEEEQRDHKEQKEEKEAPNDDKAAELIQEEISLRKEKEDQDFESYFQEYFDDEFRSFPIEKKEAISLENITSGGLSLWDHLDWQANLSFFNDKNKKIARYIIGNINEEGYLTVSIEDIAKAMNESVEKVNEVREKIKRFDPVGVGSLTLKEALLIQIDYYDIKDDITRKIVSNHLNLVGKSDFSKLAKKLGISPSEVRPHVEVIKRLNPTPGRKYSMDRTSYIVPDVIVKKEGDEYKVIVSDEGLPHIRISRFYKNILVYASKEDSDAYLFLKDKMKKAFWFLKSLNQRNQTIYKVAKYIVDKQKDFFEKGIEFIKPLTLVELAQEIGVHESTVGRVVTNKYMMTPSGVFSLKYFFHKSLTGDFGEEVSSLRIKERIKKLVESEDKQYPLSDIEIGQILAKENFYIARRTVAKYRKQLKIPPSNIRKRKYWMEGI
ncbi:MAG: RNA polymerase factor sigma-54 [Candidatus Aminicenantes bacterium]|nr:RNA polymerase factor sigma-54 [Candidatus Aminicenantes bacterium]